MSSSQTENMLMLIFTLLYISLLWIVYINFFTIYSSNKYLLLSLYYVLALSDNTQHGHTTDMIPIHRVSTSLWKVKIKRTLKSMAFY